MLQIEQPDLMDNAVDEPVRFVTPVIHMRRTVTVDTELAGHPNAAGERVGLLYGAANRDPDMFEDPDVLDLTRPNAKNPQRSASALTGP